MLEEYAIEIFDTKIRLIVEVFGGRDISDVLPFHIKAHANRIGDLSTQLWWKDRTAPEDSTMTMTINEWIEYMTSEPTNMEELVKWLKDVHNMA